MQSLNNQLVMCLTVSRFWHRGKIPKPKIAKRNIHVYKALAIYTTTYVTPFQRRAVIFKNKICNLKAELGLEGQSDRLFYVSTGIHSCRTTRKAIRVLDDSFIEPTHYSIKHAIIPKGSEYFIGAENDLVSNNLLIFETKEAYKAYRKKLLI